jgi:transcriptional regulator with XRE-family HTH domain
MPSHANLGSRLRQCRERLGLSQNELARRSGVNVATINRLESGRKTDLGARQLQQLAEVFRVSTDYLLGRTDQETADPERRGTRRGRIWRLAPRVPAIPLRERITHAEDSIS